LARSASGASGSIVLLLEQKNGMGGEITERKERGSVASASFSTGGGSLSSFDHDHGRELRIPVFHSLSR
jgi:hypothetical protein